MRPPLPSPPRCIQRPAELLGPEDADDEECELSESGPVVDQHPHSSVSPVAVVKGPTDASRLPEDEERDMAVWDEEVGGGYGCTTPHLQPATPEGYPVALFRDLQIEEEIAEGGFGKVCARACVCRYNCVRMKRDVALRRVLHVARSCTSLAS